MAYLHDGNPGEAVPHLRHALSIYQRVGAHAARRVQQTLYDHGLTATGQLPRLPAKTTHEGRHPGPGSLQARLTVTRPAAQWTSDNAE